MRASMADTQIPALPKYISRGRRPFLVPEPSYRSQSNAIQSNPSRRYSSKSAPVVRDEDDERGEMDTAARGWKSRSQLVMNWMRSNPLNLGLDDDSVRIIKEQLQRGNQANGNQDVEEKCWKHICVEFETVPGNPTKEWSDEDKDASATASVKEIGVQVGTSAVHAHLPSIQQPGALPRVNGVFPAHRGNSRSNNQSSRSETSSTSTSSESRSTTSSTAKKAPVPTGKPHRSSKQVRRRFNIPLGKDHVYLSKMTMLERHEYCLSRKKRREESKRRQREEQERAACAYDPKRFTKRSEFSNVESIVKKIVQSPSPSPGGRQKKLPEAFAKSPSHSTLSNKELIARTVPDDAATTELHQLNAEAVILDTPSADTLPCNMPSEQAKRLGSKRGTRSGSAILPETTTDRKPTNSKPKPNPRPKDRVKPNRDDPAPEESKLLDSCKLELLQSTLLKEADLLGAKLPGSPLEEAQGSQVDRNEDEDYKQPVPKHKYSFLPNSTDHRGKIQLQDHTDFQLDSFYRKRDRGSAKPGVSLMMGRREDDFSEQVVHVVFDRYKFTEGQASEWMERNIHRFKTGAGQSQAE